MDREQLALWIETLRQSWEQADPRRAAELFTNEATYHSHPFGPPLEGRQEIERYWIEATASQGELKVAMGVPIFDGDKAVVEWWATASKDGSANTDCGALILSFDGDRCRDLREYWNLTEGTHTPPEGWGT